MREKINIADKELEDKLDRLTIRAITLLLDRMSLKYTPIFKVIRKEIENPEALK